MREPVKEQPVACEQHACMCHESRMSVSSLTLITLTPPGLQSNLNKTKKIYIYQKRSLDSSLWHIITPFHITYFNHPNNKLLTDCSFSVPPLVLTHWHTFSELVTYIMTGDFHPCYPPISHSHPSLLCSFLPTSFISRHIDLNKRSIIAPSFLTPECASLSL